MFFASSTYRAMASVFCGTIFVCGTVASAGSGFNKQESDEPTAGRLVFRDALARLGKANHVGFVIEGEPNWIVLQKRSETLDLEPQDAEPAGASPVDVKIRRIAASFDYAAVRHGNLYLFRKKYTYPQDVPGVTPGECFAAAQELRDMTQAIIPDFDAHERARTLEGLIASLSLEQWKSLSTAHFLKTVTDLDVDQRAALSRFVLHQYTFGALGFDTALGLLNPNYSPRFGTSTVGGQSKVCGLATISDQGQPREVLRAIDAKMVTEKDRLEQASEERLGLAEASANRQKIAVTIGQAVEALNQRLGSQHAKQVSSHETISVDAALKAKPITIIGTEVASPTEITSAIASVYGLRVHRAPNAPDNEVITRVPISKLERPQDASLIAHEIIPLPLRTALQVDREDELRAMPTYNFVHTPEQSDLMRTKLERHQRILEHRQRVMDCAGRQLLGIIRPLFRSESSVPLAALPTFPLDSVAAYTQFAYVTYCLREFTRHMDQILYPPWSVEHFDDVCITLSPDLRDKSRPKERIDLCMYDQERHGLGMGMISTEVPVPADRPALSQH